MWLLTENRSARIRRFGKPVAAVLVLAALAAGCGFQPAGRAQLPAAMHSTYIDSSQPYGDFENMLRRTLAQNGVTVVEDRAQASAVLQIMRATSTRRVLVADVNGRSAEYVLNYRVRFQLLDGRGQELLAPQTLRLSRDYAYSVTVELGVANEVDQVLANLQQEATRLILFRLEALRRNEAATEH
ncbi:MAG: LPS assembly lipoprotein LptE [Gammaproteobacteria bacterium]